MKKKVRWITKQDVIEALRTEPILKRGNFFKGPCKTGAVCAVGAVLRRMSFEKFLSDVSDDIGLDVLNYFDEKTGTPYSELGDVQSSLDHKEWLNALSVYFETGHSRKQCIKFVEKNFPARFRLEMTREG